MPKSELFTIDELIRFCHNFDLDINVTTFEMRMASDEQYKQYIYTLTNGKEFLIIKSFLSNSELGVDSFIVTFMTNDKSATKEVWKFGDLFVMNRDNIFVSVR